MPAMQEVSCKHCGSKRQVRVADVKRGWGKFCNKSCKAKYQSKSGKSNKYYHNKRRYEEYQNKYGGNPQFHPITGEYEGFTETYFSNEE